MEKKRRISVKPALAVTLWVLLLPLAQAGCITTNWANNNLINKNKTTSIPIWQITQDGSSNSVKWVEHAPNPRFATYDPNGDSDPADENTFLDDVVLDKETGLVWERYTAFPARDWYDAKSYCYDKNMGDRKGFRLPSVEELASLVKPDKTNPALPDNHPFVKVEPSTYWSHITLDDPTVTTPSAYTVDFYFGHVGSNDKLGKLYVRCVRGGN